MIRALTTQPILFVGEAVTDGILVVDDASESPFTFERRTVDPEAWADEVAGLGTELQIHAGGSMANACRAAMRVLPAPWPVAFSVTRSGPRARARFPLHWPGHNSCVEQLAAVGVRVLGYTADESLPEWPGTLIRVGRDAVVRHITAVDVAAPAAERGNPAGRVTPVETLVLRCDDWARVPDGALDESTRVFVLASDDLVAGGLEPIVGGTGPGNERWLFCTAAVMARLGGPLGVGAGWNVVVTNGEHPCEIWQSGQVRVFDVPTFALPVGGSDLGAGDAYMGAFVASIVLGVPVDQAHLAGCAAARDALGAPGAVPAPPRDLNRVFPDRIDRSSPRDDEGAIRTMLRRAPGVSILSGGQTGVDWLIGEAAIAEGLLVQGLLPAGLRQEDRWAQPEDFRGWGIVRELGSPSFRYRTWALAHMADAVVMVDLGGSVGSAATVEAAQHFGRPIIDATTASEVQIGEFLAETRPRVVLVAGTRGSLLRASGLEGRARQVTRTVARAVRRENACRLGADGSPDRSGRVRTLVAPTRVLGLPAVRELLDEVEVQRVVPLETGRDCAAALESGIADAALTWPALLRSPESHTIHPLGAHPVSYGFSGRGRGAPGQVWGVQYPYVYQRTFSPPPGRGASVGIIGGAERWIAGGLVDLAFDSMFTGRSTAELGLEHHPSTWDCLSLCVRRPDPEAPAVHAAPVGQEGETSSD